jgi:hypothetical protein
VFSEDEHPGVAAAENHLALTNPVGSGRVITLNGVFISQANVAAVSAASPLRGYLAGSVSGGTLQSASTIGKVRSNMPDPVGQIRVTGVTATLGAAWFNSPPLFSTGAASATFVHQVPATVPSGSITLLPGESTVIRSESGDTDQRVNISIAWNETLI